MIKLINLRALALVAVGSLLGYAAATTHSLETASSDAAAAQTSAPLSDESFAKYGQEFKGKIGRTYAESQEWYPETRMPKPGTPNVLIILLDDVGFSHLGSY